MKTSGINNTYKLDTNISIVLLVSTLMSERKTTSARTVTNIFKIAGLKGIGAKLSGAVPYNEILALKDVYSIIKTFDIVPGIITGISNKTLAGRALVEKLYNVNALNLN